jgi:D-alanyl-D-alanine carboxypeptidase
LKDGVVAKAKGYGFANLEHRSPANATTVYQTASIGKQFTAALVMLLVRDGKIRLDEDVSTYLPEAPSAWTGITVRHLLTHTAGLDRQDPAIDLRKDYSESELLQSAYKVPLVGKPGEKHEYSNLGYQVLGFLCSRVAGKFYGDQLRERIFLPLGMTARVISEQAIIQGRAAGYERSGGRFGNQLWVAPSQNTTADGSLYVSPIDMARWSSALQNEQVLTKAEKETMWQPTRLSNGQSEDYGFGWKLFNESGHRVVRHRGDWQGFTTHIFHLPKERLTISVLMNRAHAQPHVIVDRIAAHYLPALRKPTELRPSAEALLAQPLFLRGTMNEWMPTAPFVKTSPQALKARAVLPKGMQEFKIADANWRIADFGVNYDEQPASASKAQLLRFKGDNIAFDVIDPGEHTFTLTIDPRGTPSLLITPPASNRQ